MRLSYYRFPEEASEEIKLSEGCAVMLKDGREIFVQSIPEDKRHLVEHVSDIVGPTSVTQIKQLMKKYGGYGYTEHYERDGSLFEVSEIALKGNNSRFKYNHHL